MALGWKSRREWQAERIRWSEWQVLSACFALAESHVDVKGGRRHQEMTDSSWLQEVRTLSGKLALVDPAILPGSGVQEDRRGGGGVESTEVGGRRGKPGSVMSMQ